MAKGKQDRDTITSSAIEIASEEERDAYISRACGNDDKLKRQVEEQVALYVQAGSHEEPAPTASATPPAQHPIERAAASHSDGREQPITRIGPYKVLRQIGEGVAGIVFQAEQQQPDDLVVSATPAAQAAGVVFQGEQQSSVSSMVALKVIKKGFDWSQIVARFEAEREALAVMDHPNIAKVLAAGTRESGQPYFVMEWVDGVPITRYCDLHRLKPRERLELFVPVCQAVQYALQKGVTHGDLKPSNVLVATQDGKPVPKVLDFGVAKLVRRRPIEIPSSSDPRGPGGQPEYMSPEEADDTVLDVDTRSDVYSLGVLLYELLTGSTPLTRDRLQNASISEVLRLIREEEAPPPSTRLVESKIGLAAVAEKRHMKPHLLLKTVHGQLDCLVLKALQKDRTRRYETASALARDIQSYLADEPMEACPPSTARQFWNLARKHSRVAAAAAVVLFLLLVGAVGGTGLAVWAYRNEEKATKAKDEAVDKQKKAEDAEAEAKAKLQQSEEALKATAKERDVARTAEKTARRSDEETKAVLGFLMKTLLSPGRPPDASLTDTFWARDQGKDITLRKAVDVAESHIAEAFADKPLGEATIREMLGLTYLNLGEPAKAVKQYERALELREGLLGVNHPDTATCRNQLAVAYRLAGRTVEAARLFNQNPNSPEYADGLAISGSLLLYQNKPAEAELKLRACLMIRERTQPDEWTTFDTKSMLGEALLQQKKFAEAEPLLLSGYEGMKQRENMIPSQEKPLLTKALGRLVKLYQDWGKEDKAIRWGKELEVAEATKKL